MPPARRRRRVKSNFRPDFILDPTITRYPHIECHRDGEDFIGSGNPPIRRERACGVAIAIETKGVIVDVPALGFLARLFAPLDFDIHRPWPSTKGQARSRAA